MAFYIEADTIYITKGDDAVLEISGITALPRPCSALR